MDDQFIAAILGRPEQINDAYVRRRAENGLLSEEDAELISRHVLHRRGRNRLTNQIRDVRINRLVEALQEEGISFRAACARVAPFVNLSAPAVVSICRKERKAV